ncbi:hypothetical protein [Aquirufa salirivi]|uniref:Redoxin domain-containing protein n=1 Tax=Aquirufa salirivi TaxID=3104729 RepID=A0ABW8RVN3_9BACT
MKDFYRIVFLKLESRNIAFLLLLFLGFNIACNKTNSPSSILTRLIIENGKSIEPNFSGYVLMIPNDGCHPCIQKALKLTAKYLNHKHIYFVITTDFDFKSTKLKFSGREILSNNLVFDIHKKSNQLGLHKSNLTVLYFKEGEMIFEKAINPTTASFELFELQSRIDRIKG